MLKKMLNGVFESDCSAKSAFFIDLTMADLTYIV
jgi:hypothetical protein